MMIIFVVKQMNEELGTLNIEFNLEINQLFQVIFLFQEIGTDTKVGFSPSIISFHTL